MIFVIIEETKMTLPGVFPPDTLLCFGLHRYFIANVLPVAKTQILC